MVNGRGRLSLAQLQEKQREFRALNDAQLAILLVEELAERANEFLVVGVETPESTTMAETIIGMQELTAKQKYMETCEAVMLMATRRAVTLETLSRLGDRYQHRVTTTEAMPVSRAIKQVRRRKNR